MELAGYSKYETSAQRRISTIKLLREACEAPPQVEGIGAERRQQFRLAILRVGGVPD